MIKVDLVRHEDVESIISKNFHLVESAILDSFRYYMEESINQPKKIKLVRPEGTLFIEDRIFALPVYVGHNEGAGVKWTSRYPEGNNHVLIVLNEPTKNRPVAIMDGCLIALLRTFAITKISLDIMLPNVKVITLLGMGKLGCLHATYLELLYPHLTEIRCYSKTASYSHLCSEVIKPCLSLEEAMDSTEVIVTCGRQGRPYISQKMISAHTRLIINLALFDLMEEVFENADQIILDDKESCINSIIPFSEAYKNKKIAHKKIKLLGDYILKNESFDPDPYKLTIVNTQGMGVQDIVLAKRIHDHLTSSKLQQFDLV